MLGIAATGSRHIETINARKVRQSGMLEGVNRGSLDGGGGAYMTWHPDSSQAAGREPLTRYMQDVDRQASRSGSGRT